MTCARVAFTTAPVACSKPSVTQSLDDSHFYRLIVVQPAHGLAHKHIRNSTSILPFTQIQRKSAHSNPRTLLHLVMRPHAHRCTWRAAAAQERLGPACCVSTCVSYYFSVHLAYRSFRLPCHCRKYRYIWVCVIQPAPLRSCPVYLGATGADLDDRLRSR